VAYIAVMQLNLGTVHLLALDKCPVRAAVDQHALGCMPVAFDSPQLTVQAADSGAFVEYHVAAFGRRPPQFHDRLGEMPNCRVVTHCYEQFTPGGLAMLARHAGTTFLRRGQRSLAG